MVHHICCLIGMQISCDVLAVRLYVVIRYNSDVEKRSVA